MSFYCRQKTALLRKATLKNNGGLHCLICLHLFIKKKTKLELHKKGCENKNFLGVVISSGGTRILKFNQ